MTTDTQRATTDLRQHPHAQFFRDNPTFESVEEAAQRKVITDDPRAKGGMMRGTYTPNESDIDRARKAADRAAAEAAVHATDLVNHPPHYTSDPSGVECIQITRHRNFNVGNAIKYLWRNGLKESASQSALDKQIEDLRKVVF